MIRCELVCKSYGYQPVLNNFSHTFCQGNTYLQGKNGSGKSTLLRLIAGIESVDAGSITFEEQANRVSIATDSIQTPDVFTPNEIFQFICVYNDVDSGVFQHLVCAMEIEHYLHTRLSDLSTGTVKKFANIFAIAKRSDWLILDEPFNALDVKSVDVLSKAIMADGRSKIITDHHQHISADFIISL